MGSASFANDIASWLHPIPDGRADGTGKKYRFLEYLQHHVSLPPLPVKEDSVLAARFWSLSCVEYRKMQEGILSRAVLCVWVAW